MKRRIFALLSAALLLTGVFACGKTPEPAKSSSAPEESTETETEEYDVVHPIAIGVNRYFLSELIRANAVKILGRTMVERTYVTMDWSGCGLEAHVRSSDTVFRIAAKSSYQVVWSAEVDGKEVVRDLFSGESVIEIPLTAGDHFISIVKENAISTDPADHCYLGEVTFDGTFYTRPEDRAMLIEFIGDSITCGFGARGVFTPGLLSPPIESSARDSYASVVSYYADADYSLVCRGGIGLLKSQGEEGYTLRDLYPYVSAYRDREHEWGFDRIPDVIILEASTNDSAYPSDEWYGALEEMISIIREKNGKSVPIVWVGMDESQYWNAVKLKDATGDEQLYAVQVRYGSSGGAGTAASTAGHPDSNEQYILGTVVMRYLSDHGLASIKKGK